MGRGWQRNFKGVVSTIGEGENLLNLRTEVLGEREKKNFILKGNRLSLFDHVEEKIDLLLSIGFSVGNYL